MVQFNTSSCGRAAAPRAVSTYPTAGAAAPDVVQGVPLHFGSIPATEARRVSHGHTAAVREAPRTAAPQVHAVDAYIPPPPPTQRRLSAAAVRRNANLRADLLSTPGVARKPSRAEQAGVVAVDAALFPLRVVRFAVALPYHAVGAAHRATRYALGADSK